MKKTQRGEILGHVLGIVGASGVVVVGALCPGLLTLAKPLLRNRYQYPSFRRAVQAVDEKGWIVAKQTGDNISVRLTKRGQAELLKYELGQKKLQSSGSWDKKWHVLAFDIPETRRRLRDRVRRTLRALGFQRLQHSVWIYPYECRAVLRLLQLQYGVRNEALYARLDQLDNDFWLCRRFHLPYSKVHRT